MASAEWKPIGTLPAATRDGRPVMLKRICDGAVAKEGLGVWDTAAMDAPKRQAMPPDPLGRLFAEETQAQREAVADRKGWLILDRRYRFPEPTHWMDDHGEG